MQLFFNHKHGDIVAFCVNTLVLSVQIVLFSWRLCYKTCCFLRFPSRTYMWNVNFVAIAGLVWPSVQWCAEPKWHRILKIAINGCYKPSPNGRFMALGLPQYLFAQVRWPRESQTTSTSSMIHPVSAWHSKGTPNLLNIEQESEHKQS